MGKCLAGRPPGIPACPPPRNGLPFRRMLKTGLIQPETIPGHFPRNLRTIVELYRSCLDAGAELVLCPPLALSGVHTGELALRSGFRTQHRAALAYLAREIADVPLLLGAFPGRPLSRPPRMEKNAFPSLASGERRMRQFFPSPRGEKFLRRTFPPHACCSARLPMHGMRDCWNRMRKKPA